LGALTKSSRDQGALAAPAIEAQHERGPDDPVEPPEQALLDHAVAGMRLDLAGDGRVDHESMNEWGPARTVRAAVLRQLLVEPQRPVHSKGVRLCGARISGRLDLESATVRCPLLLEDCYLDAPEPVALDRLRHRPPDRPVSLPSGGRPQPGRWSPAHVGAQPA
jgi:hypothetical protein